MNKAFQALADPTRRTILKKLNKGEMTAGQIADCFDITDVLGRFYEFTHRM